MSKKVMSVFCVFVLLLSVVIPTEAATNKQGYAVYRDGVSGDGSTALQWHAGVMMQTSVSYIEAVCHATFGYDVELVTWNRFISGENFVGYYKPITSISTTNRDAVMLTARSLASEEIRYTVLLQMDYDADNNPDNHGYVWVSDIYAMRCDGVVEYCYENHNIRIYGTDPYWNITKWSSANKAHHALMNITPKSQAQQYMTLISTVE